MKLEGILILFALNETINGAFWATVGLHASLTVLSLLATGAIDHPYLDVTPM